MVNNNNSIGRSWVLIGKCYYLIYIFKLFIYLFVEDSLSLVSFYPGIQLELANTFMCSPVFGVWFIFLKAILDVVWTDQRERKEPGILVGMLAPVFRQEMMVSGEIDDLVVRNTSILPEDLSLNPSTHSGWFQPSVTLAPGDPMLLASHTHTHVRINADRQTDRQIDVCACHAHACTELKIKKKQRRKGYGGDCI